MYLELYENFTSYKSMFLLRIDRFRQKSTLKRVASAKETNNSAKPLCFCTGQEIPGFEKLLGA